VLNAVLRHAEETGLENRLEVRASFCFEECEHGPNATIDGEHVHHCTAKETIKLLNSHIEREKEGKA
jgi:NADH-quinone oxidoreductase subunit G